MSRRKPGLFDKAIETLKYCEGDSNQYRHAIRALRDTKYFTPEVLDHLIRQGSPLAPFARAILAARKAAEKEAKKMGGKK